MVNIQSFITSIQNLTSETTFKELVNFSRKWLDEVALADKLSLVEIEKILTALPPNKFSIGNLCGQIAKLHKLKSDADLLEFLRKIKEILPEFNQLQINWAPDIYFILFEHIADRLLKNNVPFWGVQLTHDAIGHITYGQFGRLTNLHATLFCLCLKARHFDCAMPFLSLNVTDLFCQAVSNSNYDEERNGGSQNVSSTVNPTVPVQQSTSFLANILSRSFAGGSSQQSTHSEEVGYHALKARQVLLYFYYGAMILIAMDQCEKAELFLEHAICLPTAKPSTIVLEAFKKYILVGLIIGRPQPVDFLPAYRSSTIQRSIIPLASMYTKIPALILKGLESKEDIAQILQKYLNEKRNAFNKDNNTGLMKVLINSCKDNAIKRLGNVFVSLSLKDVSRLAFVQEMGETEQIIRRLCQANQLVVKINDRTQTFRFEEDLISDDEVDDATKQQTLIENTLTEVIDLSKIVRSFDDAVRKSPNYIGKKTLKVGERGGNGSSGNMGMFPDEEMISGGNSD